MIKLKNQSGMTLVEVLVAMVLLTLAIQGAMSLMNFTAKTKTESEHKGTLKLVALNFKKITDRAVDGLDMPNFEKGIFYSLNASNGSLTSIDTNPAVTDIKKHLAPFSPPKNSSFSFYLGLKTTGSDVVRKEIISYCSEITNYNIDPDWADLKDITHWPFVRFTSSGAMNIQCCPKDNPNCSEADGNIFSPSETKYVVKSMMYTWKNGAVIKKRSLIKKGEQKHINGMGVFIYTPTGVSNKLRAITYNYWNHCITLKIKGEATEGCKPRYYKQFSKIQKTFDISLGGGVNELGDLNI